MPPKSSTLTSASATTTTNNQQQQQQQQQQPNDNNQPTNKTNKTNNQHETKQQQAKTTDQETQRIAIERFAESVHLVQGFADTLDAIPPSLTRSLSDLKELDAVLSTPLNQLHSRLDQLTDSLKQPQSIKPEERLKLLRKMMSDIESYKLGAQDKIRVANGTCESLSHHIRQLDTTTSLLISSLPPSLERKIPPSTFPTGYPKLTGSLRSKPIGGVWQNSNPSNLQHPSPPSIPTREFINFHQGSPGRQLNHHHQQQHRPFDPQPPLSKRPRLGPSGLPYQTDDDPLSLRRDHQQPELGGKLLDQHVYSQSILDPHRAIHQDDLANHLGAPCAGKTINLAAQHSQLGLASPNSNLNAPTTKNKRSRIPSGLAEPETEDWSHPTAKLNPGFQPPTAVGPKKRSRKSNPAGVGGKIADRPVQPIEEPTSSGKTMEQRANGFSSTQFTSPSSHPNKPTTVALVGGTSRKSATGVRQTNGAPGKTDGPTGTTAPAPAKRAYTKRSGLTNPGGATGGSKGKRGANAAKKILGGTEGGGSGEPGRRKTEGTGERGGRKSAPKEAGVRLDDVAEAGVKARYRKTGVDELTESAGSGRRHTPGVADPESELVGRPDDEAQDDEELGAGSTSLERSVGRQTTKTQSIPSRKRKDHHRPDDEDHDNPTSLVLVADDDGHSSDGSNHSSSTKAYCICKGEVYGDRMVACDNSECPIEWFHYQCAGLTEDPTGNWFCPDCRSQGFGSPECFRSSQLLLDGSRLARSMEMG